jgi:hypothetical protein
MVLKVRSETCKHLDFTTSVAHKIITSKSVEDAMRATDRKIYSANEQVAYA